MLNQMKKAYVIMLTKNKMLFIKAESFITGIIAKVGKTTRPKHKFFNHILSSSMHDVKNIVFQLIYH